MVVLSGRITNTINSIAICKVTLRTLLNMVRSSLLRPSLWHLRTITPTMLLKATISHLSSTVHNSPLSNFNTINHPTMVLPKVVPRSSGRVLPSMVSPHSMPVVAVVEDLIMVAVDMKLLSWAPQFVWDLTIMGETRWLKRAMASLTNILIKVLLQFNFLNQCIKAIRRKVMEDNVHHLTTIHSLALIVAEEI
jgi:hypothetical protein